eukprot:TRINITY_DN98659_c0_g1_i1.p1 TRINITY_DN98659_c0_g1~~TRINITY_DN98659_c0_g1_i1.p1  ORF type:complete len:762 (+),score=122.28 TRINITY_DN98659_c0_g1_i1:62-2347(+)
MLPLLVAVLAALGASNAYVTTDTPEEKVDLLAGTNMTGQYSDSNGNTLPQVKRPWGFNDWVPQTNGGSGSWWFHRASPYFEGMRCTHQPSPWIGDYGFFSVLPTLDELPTPLRYSSEQSIFRPHFFKSTLRGAKSWGTDSNITLEVAPTNRAAAFRITYPSTPIVNGKRPRFFLNAGKSGANVNVVGDQIVGFTTTNSGGVGPGGIKMYFVMRMDSLGALAEIVDPTSGTMGFLSFNQSSGLGQPVTVYLGTSLISIEQARLNLEREIGGRSFDAIVEDGRLEWCEALGKIEVKMETEERLRVFYTNLWKSMLFPRIAYELDVYGNPYHWSPYVAGIRPGKLVTDSGFWDAYHTVYPFLSIVFPERLGEIIDGWVHAYSDSGWLPTWASPGQRGSMIGTMGDVSLADAIVKSMQGFLHGFDVQKAYEAIRKDAFVEPYGGYGRLHLTEYLRDGFVSSEYNTNAVSETLYYLTADAAIANAAAALGKTEDVAMLQQRLSKKDLLFSSQTDFFQPRSGKEWTPGFDPLAWGNGFTEASAWQYRFMLPFDVDALKKLYSGRLCKKIEDMLYDRGTPFKVGSYGQVIHEMSELAKTQPTFGLYAHNNQPSHDILWIAKRAGCNEIADKYLRLVMQLLYTEKGWSGDEDNGEMAAWYVLSALGLYSLEGGALTLVVGSPSVVEATLHLNNGKSLKVTTRNQGPQNVYVQSVYFKASGAAPSYKIQNNEIKFSELMKGGELRFELSSKPSTFQQTLRGGRGPPENIV